MQAAHALREGTDLLLSGSVRLGRDASHPVYERLGAGLAFRMSESGGRHRYLTLTPHYTYTATQPFAGEDRRENRLTLETTGGVSLGRWTVSDRNDIDRRFIDPKPTTRYRNRVQLERKLRLAHTALRGFASDEISYEWRYNAWTRNRFIIGAGKSLSERVTLDLYYVRQNDGYGHPGDLNAVGFTLRTRF
jgi:hypothetical protein